jgi:hypothetical protein
LADQEISDTATANLRSKQTSEVKRVSAALGRPPVPKRETPPKYRPDEQKNDNPNVADLQATVVRLSDKVREQASRILRLGKELQDAKDDNSKLKLELESKSKEFARQPSVEPPRAVNPANNPSTPDRESMYSENEELIKYKLDTDRRMCNQAKLNQSLLKELDMLESRNQSCKSQLTTLLSKAKSEERLTNQSAWAASFTRQLMSRTLSLLVIITSEFLSVTYATSQLQITY